MKLFYNKDEKAKLPVWGQFLYEWLSFALLWCPAVTLFVTFAFDNPERLNEFWESFVISLIIGENVLLCCMIGSYTLAFFEELICNFYGWIYREQPAYIHTIKSALFVLPGLYLGFLVAEYFEPIVGYQFDPPGLGAYKRGIVIGIMIMAIVIAIDLYSAKKVNDAKLEKAEKENLKSRIAALNAQMNPHLLFNALNSVAATIHDNPEQAEDMTVDLADLYRKILAATKNDYHSLSQELEICRSYLAVEKSRFGDRLEYQVNTDADAKSELKIPTLILQPLVENAVKHGISAAKDGGRVTISTHREPGKIHLTVHNTGAWGTSQKGTGSALENIKNRLALLYGQRASFDLQRSAQTTKANIIIPDVDGLPT